MATRPTPYDIALSSLIALHCQDDSPLHEDKEHDAAKVDSFLQETLLSSASSTSDHAASPERTESANPDTSLMARLVGNRTINSFLRLMEKNLGEDMTRVYCCWLQVAVGSIDSLIDIMATCRQAVESGVVDSNSTNGVLLRSVALGFDQLSFESVSVLWSDLSRQVKRAIDAMRSESPEFQNTSNDGNPDDKDHLEFPLNPKQIEEALSQLVRRQSQHQDQQLDPALEDNPELPSGQFLHFLAALRTGEREVANDSLHRYLDYTLVQKRARGEQGQDSVLQFASILAAAMHEQFGDRFMSLFATEEAVRIAQQGHDASCIAFALGWLSLHSNASCGEDLIHRCIQRCSEDGTLRALGAGANLTLSQTSLQTRSKPSLAWRHLASALAEEVSADTSLASDRPSHIRHFRSGTDVHQIVSRQHLVAAGIWQHCGQEGMASLSLEAALLCDAGNLYSTEAAMASLNKANSQMFGFSNCLSKLEKPLGLHLPIVPNKIFSDRSFPNQSLKEMQPSHVEGKSIDCFLLELERATRMGDLSKAEIALTAVGSFLSPRATGMKNSTIDMMSQRCLLLLGQRRFKESMELLSNLAERCANEGLTSEQARLLLQLAMVRLESLSPNRYATALPPLFQSLNLSRSRRMDSFYAAAMSLLAKIHLRMNKPKRSIAVLRSVLPTILQSEHLWMQGEAFLTMAKAQLLQAKKQSNARKSKNLQSAIMYLTRCERLFKQCADVERLREVYYLQARVYNAIPGNSAQRNEASRKYLLISRRDTRSGTAAH